MSASRFDKRYEDEQRELLERIKALKDELERSSSQSMTTDMFIATVRKYTAPESSRRACSMNWLSVIEVYHAEKVNGYRLKNQDSLQLRRLH
jgi:hypothetical protein